MLDMTINDAQAITGYQQAMRNGDYDSANQYFNQIENGEQKFINAHKINNGENAKKSNRYQKVKKHLFHFRSLLFILFFVSREN